MPYWLKKIYIDIVWISNDVIHKKVTVIWLWALQNVIYSNYEYLFFGSVPSSAANELEVSHIHRNSLQNKAVLPWKRFLYPVTQEQYIIIIFLKLTNNLLCQILVVIKGMVGPAASYWKYVDVGQDGQLVN